MHSPRPAFVAVRDAIVCHGCVGGIVVKETGNGLSKSRSCERCDGSGYDAENAEAAIERLHSAGLYPWRFDDETAPRWWCDRCEGTGLVCTTDGENMFDTPCRCRGPSFREIEAVASLGAHPIGRAVGIAGEIAAKAGVPAARVMWRVMPWLEARTRCWPVVPGVRPNGDYGCDLIEALPKAVHLLDVSHDRIVLGVEGIDSITLHEKNGEITFPPNVTHLIVHNRYANTSSALLAMPLNSRLVASATAGHGFVAYTLQGDPNHAGTAVRFAVYDDEDLRGHEYR